MGWGQTGNHALGDLGWVEVRLCHNSLTGFSRSYHDPLPAPALLFRHELRQHNNIVGMSVATLHLPPCLQTVKPLPPLAPAPPSPFRDVLVEYQDNIGVEGTVLFPCFLTPLPPYLEALSPPWPLH